MSKRKILILALSLCMVAILAVGGSLAYFTDAEQTTNIMTIGNIEIDLEEAKYVDGKWVALDNTQPIDLFPISSENLFEHDLMYNKAVRVYNTSSSGDTAYLRTIIAVPASLENLMGWGFASNTWNKEEADGVYRHGCKWTKAGSVKFSDGVDYIIYVCDTVNGAKVEKGDYMLSMTGVWLYETVTNEDIQNAAGLTKVNGGYKFDIKILAQGIQTEGFDSYEEAMETFGNVMTNVVDWFEGENKAGNAVINNIFTAK